MFCRCNDCGPCPTKYRKQALAGAWLYSAWYWAALFSNGIHRLVLLDFQRGIDFLEHVGARAPTLDGAIVTLIELLAGAALALGLFTRWAAGALMLGVLIGLWIVDVNAASFLPAGGKFTLILMAATFALIPGQGRRLCSRQRARIWEVKPVVEDLDVAVRLEKRGGRKLARCIVSVRNRCTPSGAWKAKPEMGHGSYPG